MHHFKHYVTCDGAEVRRGPDPRSPLVCLLAYGATVWAIGFENVSVGTGKRKHAATVCKLTFPFEAYINRRCVSVEPPKPRPRPEDASDDDWD